MIFRCRALARLGAVAAVLLAAGVLAAPASAAATADLELKAEDVTIAAGSSGKLGRLSLINHGPSDAPDVLITFDARQLDKSKIRFETVLCDQPTPDVHECSIATREMDVVPVGADVDWGLRLTRIAGASGAAGRITASVRYPGTDPNPANNQVTVAIAIAGNGPDLAVIADDVRQAGRVDPDGKVTYSGPLVPGAKGPLGYNVVNVGDAATTGLKVTVTLPAHVTLGKLRQGCVLRGRSLVCTYPDLVLVPSDDDTDDGDAIHSRITFHEMVTVSTGVSTPATLVGAVTAESVATEQARQQHAPARRTMLPEGTRGGSARSVDVDPRDNTDEYSVIVVARSGGSGGGGGGGGTLPVTGAQAGMIGGIGLAAVAAGGVLLLVGRRRRVVPTVPVESGRGTDDA